jgi:hypothetical protein
MSEQVSISSSTGLLNRKPVFIFAADFNPMIVHSLDFDTIMLLIALRWLLPGQTEVDEAHSPPQAALQNSSPLRISRLTPRELTQDTAQAMRQQ